MKKLNFIGIGGATNIELGGNCCYIKDKDNILIIDVCEEATKKLMDKGAFKGIKNIYIAITHTHYDHVAGLGVLIWYSNFYLNIIPQIIYNDNKYKQTLKDLLKITGVDEKYFTFINETYLKLSFTVNMKPTIHSPNLQCFGIMFEDKDGKYYYTGDTKDFQHVRKLSIDPSIKKIYSEVATETYDVHIKYDDIKDLDKNKLVLMHFDTVDLYKRVIKDGFKTASIKEAKPNEWK